MWSVSCTAVLVQEGLFSTFPVDAVYALHNWPALPAGQIAVRPGPVMASVDEFDILIQGRGGHAAMPHLAVDPVVVAAHIINALQTIASRNVGPLDSVVVSVCSLATSQIGTFNVLPDTVRLIGTVRALRESIRELAERRIIDIASGVATALGATAETSYRRHNPATVNSTQEAVFAAQVGDRVFGSGNVIRDAEPSTASEDFSHMLQVRPGAYIWLGHGGEASGCTLHSPDYDFNDEILPLGAGYLAALVEAALPVDSESVAKA